MITSTANPRIRNVVHLMRQAKERRAQDVFPVEGIRMFREVSPSRRLETYVSESFLKKAEAKAALADTGYEVVSDTVFETMSDTKTPQGVICLVRQMHYTPEDLIRTNPGWSPLLLILETLQDPGNLGTILRSSEGAGVTGILMSSDCADIYNPKVVRSTMGSLLRVPFCYTDDLRGQIRALKQSGISIYAAHLKGKTGYTGQNYIPPSAFLIGNESRGLTEETAVLADHYIRIPMKGRVESLNASVAASLLVYEALRQREEASSL